MTGIERFPTCRIATATTISLRDVAKPVLEADSSAKVQMPEGFAACGKSNKQCLSNTPPRRRKALRKMIRNLCDGGRQAVEHVHTDRLRECRGARYCGWVLVVFLNDDQGGPLHLISRKIAQGIG